MNVLPAALTVALADQLPALADEILAAVAQEVPAYRRPFEGAFGDGVRLGVQEALQRFLALAVQPPGEVESATGRDVYRALGRGEARAGRSLDALLAAYRTGARLAWSRLAGIGLEVGVPPTDLVELAATVFAFIDELSSLSAEGFAAEQSRLTGDRERRLRRLVQLLMAETAVHDLEEAAGVAGWSPPATLTAVLVPVGTGRELASRWDPRSLLGAEEDAGGTALVLLPDTEGPGAQERLSRLLGDRPHVIGLPKPWVDVRHSISLARRTAALTRGRVRVADHLAGLVVGADAQALAELTALRLAPLADLTPRQRTRMLETLRSWLDHQGDRQAVAADLAIHPQTVRYRVALLRELLAGDLEDPARRFELGLVLHGQAPGREGSPVAHRA